MLNISEAVPFSFVVETVVLIFVFVGIGIMMVKRAKKVRESE